MNKFVVLALVFAALAFYELSGGADFDPETARTAALEARLQREAARKATRPETIAVQPLASAPETNAPSESAPTSGVGTATTEQIALNLVSFDAVANRRAAPPDVAAVTEAASLADLADLAETTATQDAPLGLAALDPDTPRTQSIVFPGNSLVASSSEAARERDVRIVKGTLVNMRSGPGTDYDVVDQLPQATRVEILTDAGNGWVELRPVDGGVTGWIAAFLLEDR